MNTYYSLSEKIKNAKALDFGTILSEVIELFKKVWLKGFLTVLLIFLCAFVIGFLFSVIGLSTNIYNFNDGINLETFTSFYSMNVLYSLPQTILGSVVSIGFLASFYRICKNYVMKDEDNNDYFYFFSNGYFSKIFMLGIIYGLIATIAQLLLVIPYIYVFVPISYFSVIFAFNPDLSETEIVKASFALGNKKWLISFGLIFVSAILGMLGVIACFIGVLFTISIVYLPVFYVYKEVIGFEDVSEIEQIGVKDDSDY
ncbi:hypothetical protein L3X39_00235 [Sabulilitoribacter multivorans]|uniref:Glycerophosphoryl diester phosphodiesterase membrane domain-containing protein n=1 Tax=Flaviramulus multivorans TaxID=1304750 RepID=A0ABS9IE31_9FLAO|nr:hypothetical protein [Flaviramulus multivorans]MCF7559047.1 hypothetical protein [Flaviramulus multivorans]